MAIGLCRRGLAEVLSYLKLGDSVSPEVNWRCLIKSSFVQVVVEWKMMGL